MRIHIRESKEFKVKIKFSTRSIFLIDETRSL